MTPKEIYESMDMFMEQHRDEKFKVFLPEVRAHAAELGKKVGKTEDDILDFYFKMKKTDENKKY